MNRFGAKLRILRRRRGLTMRQLGEMLEISDSYVSEMEIGDKIPDVAMVIKIADFFEADLDQLLRDEIAGKSIKVHSFHWG